MFSDLGFSYHFEDRQDAAEKLIETLPLEFLQKNEAVIISVSEGGVYFADQIAKAAYAPMDILLTAPILASNNPEIAIAMVSETEEVVMHRALIEAFEINEDYVYSEAKRKYEEEVLGYIYKYRQGEGLISLKEKYVVLVDECIETGLTMMVALKSVIAQEAKNIYIAAPVLDKTVYQNLLSVCDGVFCPCKIQDYISIEYYFKVFEKSSFEEISKTVKSYEKLMARDGKIKKDIRTYE